MFKYGDIVKYVGDDEEIGIKQKFQVIQIDRQDKVFPFRITRGNGCYWVGGSDIEKTSCVYFPIDLEKPEKARNLLEETIKKYEKSKEWSVVDLMLAEEYFKSILSEFAEKKNRVGRFEHYENEKKTVFVINDFPVRMSIDAHASKGDVFVPVIGKIVCLCKALGKPIPDFITKH